MSNQALPRPRFNAPEPEHGPHEQGSKADLKIEARTMPLLQGKVSELPDALFGNAMRLCGVAVVALLGLIVYQLVVGSTLSWHAFGWKFFAQSDWNPVEDSVRRAAVHLRHPRLFAAGARHRCAACLSVWQFSLPRCARSGCAEFFRLPPNFWPPSPAWSTDFGQSSFWCRSCANMFNRFLPKRSAGRACSADLPTASACWLRA